MGTHNLDRIFKPKRVAVVGASDDVTKVGHTVLRNLIGRGFNGVVYPVNHAREGVQGIPAYASVDKLPRPADLAVICTPAETVPDVVRQCGESGTMGLVILSAGFREVGEEGRRLEERVAAEAANYPGMRIVGPNCLGVIVPGLHLNASFAATTPQNGRLAFISQSGALCTSILDWSLSEQIGFSYFVSIGNMLDVTVADLIDYFGADARTDAILLYIESITEAREFMSATRAFARQKPIVAYKSGRFGESALAAASHTGALAGVDAVYEAALNRAGAVRVFEIDDMFDCAELLARQKIPRGPRLAIVTNAGGPGVMATDALIARKGALARLSQETIARLDRLLPAYWSRRNPVDVLGDAPPKRFADSLEITLADPEVDAALVILSPQAMTDATSTANAVTHVASRSRKPILAAWMGGDMVKPGVHMLNQGGVPTYDTPEHAVRAFMYLVQYARNLETLHETPRDIPLDFDFDRDRLHERFATMMERGSILGETDSKSLLESYGIPTTSPHLATTPDLAVNLSDRIGYPVVLKVSSRDITHKTDVGGVVLNLQSAGEVRKAFAAIMERARAHRHDARIEGVTVQRMITAVHGIELILGARRDPVFGPVVMVGTGGVAAEVFQDRALELPPLNERLARKMLESLRSWPLLKGYRGQPAANIDRLVEVLVRFSYLLADFPEIAELDINPLFVTKDDVLALDARVVVAVDDSGLPERRYGHLAIRPYPREYERPVELRDKTQLLLRPIRPEDEPLWHDLVASCSKESLWSRFRYLFKSTTHEMATRFCFIDYDREIAIVAEQEEHGSRRLLGVGRLVIDAGRESAEYGILVVDRAQGRGLGTLLTDYCLEIARRWKIAKVVAETSPDNARMLTIFRQRGFELDYGVAADVVLARRDLNERAPRAVAKA